MPPNAEIDVSVIGEVGAWHLDVRVGSDHFVSLRGYRTKVAAYTAAAIARRRLETYWLRRFVNGHASRRDALGT